MKRFFTLSLLLVSLSVFSQNVPVLVRYTNAYRQLDSLLKDNKPYSFKRAVFIVENTYFNNKLQVEKYNNHIEELTSLASNWMKFNHLNGYRYADSIQVLKNLAIYSVLKDTINILTEKNIGIAHLPYMYNFEDYAGDKDWTNMFVCKLLVTHQGNCHSQPYLYKILADEIDATCWLGLAPNHMYIKNRCKSIGWYNTELTSGSFPVDAWIMGSGYIPLEAIQSGIYMDTVSNQQSIALCVLDLAKGYEHQTHNYTDGFILKCCALSLQYFSLNVQAMLLKAETLKRIYGIQLSATPKKAKETYAQMEQVYAKLIELGYREMPAKMYLNWLKSIEKESSKFENRQLKGAFRKEL